MKFEEMEYLRVGIDEFAADFEKALARFTEADSAEAQLEAARAAFGLWQHFRTMHNLASIRHTVNTLDAFYKAENDYYDENLPRFESLENRFNKAMYASSFRPELEKALGSLLFKNIGISIAAFDEKIMDDMTRENRLCSQYQQLIASAQVEFDGKTLNLSQLGFYMNSPDREVRRKAYAVRTDYFLRHAKELDDIYDALVKNRAEQARKLGYKNYVELGYLRRERNCYGSKEVADFRELVRTKLVPVTVRIAEKQRERLGVDTLMFYDESAFFKSGNPAPQGTPEQIFANGLKMYRSLSDETGEFFDFMLKNGLFDVLGRKGKAAGGYCEDLGEFRCPFIFANFNGTHEDINTLTHESGHALQYYLSRDIYPPQNIWPTAEACEIHSMSMEFFTWPYMELFFGENADRYRYMHLSGALTFIPYGCAVDHFQQLVYEKPEMSPEERKRTWQELERAYMPYLNYGDDKFFGAGGRWQRQLHIYLDPFYYIDYCLAQTCALEFWALARKDKDAAFARYLSLCRLGGTDTFTGLLGRVGLKNPFDGDCLNTVAAAAQDWLDHFDQSRL